MNNGERTRLVFRPGEEPCGDVFVLVLLRGGMDGLYTVPPFADPFYHRSRPLLALPDPGRPDGIIDLDGAFGLHPALAALREPFLQKQLAVVHACGGPDTSLSHFEASRALERGVADARSTGTGWLTRHLASRSGTNSSPIRTIAFTATMPDVLGGTPDVALMRSIADVRIDYPHDWDGFDAVLGNLYAGSDDPIVEAGRHTLTLVHDLERLAATNDQPRHGANYPADRFGRALSEVARLIRADLGLEAVVLEVGGWDSHADQVRQLAGPLTSLGQGLAAFARDLSDRMRTVSVVALSEFGRRVRENSGGGTDHGRATAMFLLGGGVCGGKVYGRWPGLAPEHLDSNGNLPVTTDYRSVMSEVVTRRLKNPSVANIFPRFTPAPVGVVSE